jgi:TPR repeat protein
MKSKFKGGHYCVPSFTAFFFIALSMTLQSSLGQIRIIAPAATGSFVGLLAGKNKKPGQNEADPPRSGNRLSDEEKNDGWQLLFDGKTMSGWHTYNKSFPDGKWEVNDGTIHLLDRDRSGLGTSHDLVTDENYGDFDFKAEWKVAAQANSGIMIHVQERGSGGPSQTGPEMQILDNQGNPNGQQSTGRAGALYGLLPCVPDNAKPPGQWNQVEIICKGGVLNFFQNGANVVTTTLYDGNWNRLVAASAFSKFPDYGTFRSGRIDLQDWAGEVWFTNIKIKRLDGGNSSSGSVAVNESQGQGQSGQNQPEQVQPAQGQLRPVQPGEAPDLSGVWEGVGNPQGYSVFVERYFQKSAGDMYSGITILHWRKAGDNTPYLSSSPAIRTVKKAFIGRFDGNVFSETEVDTVESTPTSGGMLGSGKVQFANSNGTPELRPVNNAQGTTLRFISATFPDRYKRYLINESTFRINNIDYTIPDGTRRIKYNDRIQLTVSLSNGAPVNFKNLTARLTTSEAQNGLENDQDMKANFNLGRNSDRSYGIRILTNFAVPPDSLHFTLTISSGDVPIVQRSFAVATEPFFKTDKVVLSETANARMKAVDNYYGTFNTPYAEVVPPLNNLALSGDKLALMWKAIFTYKGNGGYKADEGQAADLAKQALDRVESGARMGDAEALYLMFYACRLGFEGPGAVAYAEDFLEKSADAGFKPAVYDYGLLAHKKKDYETAFSYFVRSYGLGVRKAASNIGTLYEGGNAVGKDVDSAYAWYQKGVAFGDPAAMVNLAMLYSTGFGDTPPDINKGLALATRAADDNYTAAMMFAGNVYLNGKQGKAQDIPLAIKWFKRAADLGDAGGMLHLGVAYLADNVPGVTRDEASGLFWIKRSAELGDAGAMKILSRMYYEGMATDKNVIRARYWYNQAVQLGAAQMERKDIEASREDFNNFWRNADFSPSYVYVNSYNEVVGDSGPDFFGGMIGGFLGSFMQRYANMQEQINGLEFIQQKNGYRIYGGTVSSYCLSGLNLKQGETVSIKAYGIISTGMMSGSANADGLGDAWAEYRIVPTIPCSAMMAQIKDGNWQFVGQRASFTATKEGPLVFAVNGIDARNYKGYFDLVIQVPEN